MIYLATPYSHPDPAMRLRRFENACMFAALLMDKGFVVFCPIAHSHPIDVYIDSAKGWDWWQKIDYPILLLCDEVHVLKLAGWEQSVGVKQEIEWAHSLVKPVVFHEESELWAERTGPR